MPSVRFNPFTASFDYVGDSGSGGTPASPDTSIQFNDGGSFGGDSTFTFDKTTNLVTLESLYSNGDWGTGATLPATLRSSGDKAIMFWNPKTGAFWAGEWDSGTLASSDVGSSSTALGYNNKASGYGSLTAGWSNSASESAAIAIGRNNIASGVESVAIGSEATASASYAVGIGRQVEAIGTASFASCVDGSAIGNYSFVANDGNEASGQASAAFGEFNLTGSFAQGSLIGGVDNTVDGTYSFVFGTNIYASANNTITLGAGAGSGASRLANATANSFVVGFGNVNPTLMVTGSNVKIGYPTNGKFAILDASSITTDRTFIFPNQSGTIALTSGVVSSITGTANQVIASASTGAVTLSLPQSIATTSDVLFDSIAAGASASSTTGDITAARNTTTGAVFFGSDGQGYFYRDSANSIQFGPSLTTFQVGSNAADARFILNSNATYQVKVANSSGVGFFFGATSGTADGVFSNNSGTERIRITDGGNVGLGVTPDELLHLKDGGNIKVGTSTGTKIGTATTQKLGFFNATPIVQPTVTGSRGGNVALASLLTQLASLGLIVDSSS